MRENRALRDLRRWRWDLQRFGLTPGGIVRRLHRVPDLAPVLCVTIPKAGTHLLERLLCLHPSFYRRLLPTLEHSNVDRYDGLERVLATTTSGQVVVTHLAYDPRYRDALVRTGTRGFLLIRDPRDVAVSLAFYIFQRPEHRFHELFVRRSALEERIRLAIRGSREAGFPSMAERLRSYRGWLEDDRGDRMMLVRFEDLVGERGGGGVERQREIVAGIFQHLGARHDEEVLDHLCSAVFSSVSPTFRAGRIGSFREHFEGSDLEAECEDSFGELLDEYGYS